LELLVSPSGNRVREILTSGASAWGTKPAVLVAIWLIPVAIVSGGVVTAIIGKDAYKWYTGEDQFAEVVQVILYALALVLGILVVRKLRISGERTFVALYAVVVVGLVFMLGEELSWGQRLFGWRTSETFAELNKQDETNLHNITDVETMFKWMQLVVGAYGTFLPLLFLLDLSRPMKRFLSFVIPHATLIPFFAPLFLWRVYRNVIAPDPPPGSYFVISEFNEVMETVLAAGMALFLLYQWPRLNRGELESPDAEISH
jgi:hypothetical protein